ncbi:PP_RS20740 family protein [Clavibacter phaseoli]|uniref:PP_RS20740 family protein n=1 Tax=Clavibacter phaseoli TaxID=1734031 RepID=UPI0011C217E8|nr:hypothetical protein [Clavibacter phaseoli]
MAESAGESAFTDSELRDLLGDGPVDFPLHSGVVFKPWHRPRKQYVRHNQWYKQVDYLVRDLKLDNGELHYLTLPGSDFIDVRHLLGTVCKKRNMTMRYLGFDTAALPSAEEQPAFDSAQYSVKRLSSVNPMSTVFGDDVRRVGDKASEAWVGMRDAGPYHVVNLDLCAAFAGPHSDTSIPTYFSAMQNILEYQGAAQQGFVLLLTTRIDDDSVSDDSSDRLHKGVERLFESCQTFTSAFTDAWDISNVEVPYSALGAMKSFEAFMLGLARWIVGRGVHFGLKASVHNFYTYRTGSGTEGDDDLVSFAIRFTADPVVYKDPLGLVQEPSGQLSEFERECQQSLSIPERVVSRVAVDQVMRDDSVQRAVCVEASAKLLAGAGYDVSEYRRWATYN